MLDALVRCLDFNSDVGIQLCPITLGIGFASDMARHWNLIMERKGLRIKASHPELQTPSLMPLPGSLPERDPFLAEEPGGNSHWPDYLLVNYVVLHPLRPYLLRKAVRPSGTP